jgi:hypothetical protein
MYMRCPAGGSIEHGNEATDSIKDEEFVGEYKDYCLLAKRLQLVPATNLKN